ncbi:MAG: 4Fe-4S dicluster domain-containing protein [Alphaproteobacteria bacterium]|nr:4Fe-4S dicluster domain-containing protein [Alphaproteobacteria bacterium]
MSKCNGGKSADCGCNSETSTPVETARRWFLKSAAAFTTIALAPNVTLLAYAQEGGAQQPGQPRGEPVTAQKRWGLLIDLSKCAEGCEACVGACSRENGWKAEGHPRTDAQWIRKVNIKNRKSGVERSLPVMCQHCDSPPCVDVCPTGASFKRADGIVLVDKHICIGCRYCVMACPYQARSFIHEPVEDQKSYAPRGKGTVESCTLCVHRVDAGREPACVEACEAAGHKAMIFGDLNDPASEISQRIAQFPTHQIRADLRLDTGVRYQNL